MSNLKFGRLPPSNRPAIKFKSIIKLIPDHPIKEDYLSNLSGWQMKLNDQIGCCVSTTWANSRKFITDILTDKEDYPSDNEVLSFYETQNPNGSDNGMDIQLALKYLVD